MKLILPTKERVEKFVGLYPRKVDVPTPPTDNNEWGKNHTAFVLRTLIPKIRPKHWIWKIVAEAYLVDLKLSCGDVESFEQALSDGSSMVPDLAYKHGMIKDPWGVAHDYVFFLNRLGMRDSFGKKWTFKEANKMYRDGWYSQGHYIIGTIWWIGLCVGGWVAWNSKFRNRPEAIDKIEYK